MNESYEVLYDTFFNIFKERQERASGKYDQFFKSNLSTETFIQDTIDKKIAMFARSNSLLGSLYSQNQLSLDDYLYLPSHLTVNRKEEMEKKYGKSLFRIDKEVSFYLYIIQFMLFADKISQQFENLILHMYPRLHMIL